MRRIPMNVVIATLCEAKRTEQLLRAIRSIQDQEGVDPEIILVVNGTRFDPELLETMRARADLRVVYQEEGNLPKAIWTGRTQVTRDYFAFLDDDDEYIKDRLRGGLDILEADPSVDVVVSNGVRIFGGVQEPIYTSMEACKADPLKDLFNQSWLNSSSGIYRTSSVPPDFFSDMQKYFEWTSIAFKMAAQKKVAFREEYVNRIHDTPGSLSKTLDFILAVEPFLLKLLELDLRPELRRALSIKLSSAYHDISDMYLYRGNLVKAWRYHIKSMRGGHGMRYLFYTRKLILFRGLLGIRAAVSS